MLNAEFDRTAKETDAQEVFSLPFLKLKKYYAPLTLDERFLQALHIGSHHWEFYGFSFNDLM